MDFSKIFKQIHLRLYGFQYSIFVTYIALNNPPRILLNSCLLYTSSPEKVYDTIEIPGKDGVLYRDNGTVKDIKIEIPLAFREQNPDLWMERLRAIKTWLLSGVDNQLSFADDKDYFYRVKKVTVGTAERAVKKQGKLTATFWCEGYMYLQNGAKEQQLSSLLNNPCLLYTSRCV